MRKLGGGCALGAPVDSGVASASPSARMLVSPSLLLLIPSSPGQIPLSTHIFLLAVPAAVALAALLHYWMRRRREP